MAVFKDNKDLDTTLSVVGIHLLVGAGIGLTAAGNDAVASFMTELLIAYAGIMNALFGINAGRKRETQQGDQQN